MGFNLGQIIQQMQAQQQAPAGNILSSTPGDVPTVPTYQNKSVTDQEGAPGAATLAGWQQALDEIIQHWGSAKASQLMQDPTFGRQFAQAYPDAGNQPYQFLGAVNNNYNDNDGPLKTAGPALMTIGGGMVAPGLNEALGGGMMGAAGSGAAMGGAAAGANGGNVLQGALMGAAGGAAGNYFGGAPEVANSGSDFGGQGVGWNPNQMGGVVSQGAQSFPIGDSQQGMTSSPLQQQFTPSIGSPQEMLQQGLQTPQPQQGMQIAQAQPSSGGLGTMSPPQQWIPPATDGAAQLGNSLTPANQPAPDMSQYLGGDINMPQQPQVETPGMGNGILGSNVQGVPTQPGQAAAAGGGLDQLGYGSGAAGAAGVGAGAATAGGGGGLIDQLGNAVSQYMDPSKRGAYQFPYADVLTAGIGAAGSGAVTSKLQGMYDQLLKSDPWNSQMGKYQQPLYDAATQGIGNTAYGQSIANQVGRLDSAKGFNMGGNMLHDLAQGLNSGTTQYMNAMTPLAMGRAPDTRGPGMLGAAIGASTGNMYNSLGFGAGSVMNGQQPAIGQNKGLGDVVGGLFNTMSGSLGA